MSDPKNFDLSPEEEQELTERIMKAIEEEKQKAIADLPEVFQRYAEYLIPLGHGNAIIPFVQTTGLMATQLWVDREIHLIQNYNIQ